MRKNDLAFNLLLLFLDFAFLNLAAFAAYFLRTSSIIAGFRPVLFNFPLSYLFTISVILSVYIIIIFSLSGLYTVKRSTPVFQEVSKVIISISAGITAVIVYMFFNLSWFNSRFILLVAWILAIVFVSFGRIFIRLVRESLLQNSGLGLERILLLGDGEDTQFIKNQISKNKRLGLHLVDYVKNPDLEIIRNHHNSVGLHRVITADLNVDRLNIMKIVNYCEENGIQFSYVPDMLGSIVADMSFDIIEGMPVVSVKPSPLDGWSKVSKRILDVFLSLIGLILLSPLFLIISFMIKWQSRGPVLVKLKRISHGREFNLYKFRSMVDNAERYKSYLEKFNERGDGPLFKISDDPRITNIGTTLRARRLDEMSQLLNVLKGDISIVGPRPHEPKEIEKYKDYHKKVLAIKSGITGMAQVRGASELSFEEEVKLDRYYIENWSIKLDIIIMLKTLRMLLFDKSGV